MTRLLSIGLVGLAAAAAACNESSPAPAGRATAGESARESDAAIEGAPADAGAASARIEEAGMREASTRPSASSLSTELAVPRARTAIRPMGHFRIDLWDGAPSTGTLRDRVGNGAVPVSESRFLWGNGNLYFFFYAGDLDLQARVDRHDGPVWNDDSVELAFEATGDGGPSDERVIRVSAKGIVSDGKCPGDAADLSDPRCDLRWESGARVATDVDGTFNDITDRDEEWAVEGAIPLASLGLGKTPGTRIPVRMSRCEIAHDGPRECGAWEGTLVLGSEPAVRTGSRDH